MIDKFTQDENYSVEIMSVQKESELRVDVNFNEKIYLKVTDSTFLQT